MSTKVISLAGVESILKDAEAVVSAASAHLDALSKTAQNYAAAIPSAGTEEKAKELITGSLLVAAEMIITSATQNKAKKVVDGLSELVSSLRD